MTSKTGWHFRPAVAADLGFIEALRNDAVSARFSRRGVLELEVVRDEFLASDRRRAFVACTQGEDVGYARFDFESDAEVGSGAALPAELSIALEAGRRGEGLGADLVAAATDFAFGHWTEGELGALHATVHRENAASLRCFARAGYRRVDDPAEQAEAFQKWTMARLCLQGVRGRSGTD